MDNTTPNYSQQSNNLANKLVSWASRFASLVPKSSSFPSAPNFSTGNKTTTPATSFPNLNTSVKSLWSLTTGYGDSTKYEKFHPGIDIANKIGTPVPSFSGWTVERIENNKSWFGNSVLIRDEQWNELRYSHLKQAYVKPWQKIAKWTEIWVMWNTWSTYSNSGWTWSHLDLRIMNAYKKYINPFTYLQQKG